MKKFVGVSVLCCATISADTAVGNSEEFLPLGEPDRVISGAYYGIGIGSSSIKHEILASKNNGACSKYSSTSNQFEISAIAGFGTPILKRYYAGIEFEIFKRLSGKDHSFDGMHVQHCVNTSMNMDVRIGYLFPLRGTLVYFTAGFARLFGRVSFDRDIGGRRRNESGGSFGSFYPTLGVGVEYKFNQTWNGRCDYRYCITSKDDERGFNTGNAVWKWRAKPNRMSVRLSLTRSM